MLTPTSSLQQEHWFEKALRDKKGFIIKQMKEDGACLFRAVGESVPQPLKGLGLPLSCVPVVRSRHQDRFEVE